MHSTFVLKEELVPITTGWSNSTGLLSESEPIDKRFRSRSGIGDVGVAGESSIVWVSTGTDGTGSFAFSTSVSVSFLVASSGLVAGGDFAFMIAAAFALSVTRAATGRTPPGVLFILPAETFNCFLCSPSVLPSLVNDLIRSSTAKLSLPLPLPLLPPLVRLPRGMCLDDLPALPTVSYTHLTLPTKA